MTSQEKYPKFYSHPHYWVNAIEVEVNCDTTGTYRTIKKSEIFQLSALTVHEFEAMSALQNLTPKFEPQEGAAFIKDLEAAVSVATGMNFTYYDITQGCHRLLSEGQKYTVKMPFLKISLVQGYKTETGKHISHIDTAAYVDKLRELGYYI